MNLIFRAALIQLFILSSTLCSLAQDAKTDSLANEPYPINQISLETENTQRFLRKTYAELSSTSSTNMLDSIERVKIGKIEKINTYLSGEKLDKLTPQQMEGLESTLHKEYDEMNKMRQSIGDKELLIDSNLKQARLQKSRWEKTLKASYSNELPAQLAVRIKNNTHKLDSAIVLLSTQNSKLLNQQDEITNAMLSLEDLRDKAQKKLDTYRRQIYNSNSLPIWKINSLSTDSTSIKENIKSSLLTKKYSLYSYRDTYSNLFSFWIICFAVFTALILRIKHNLKKRAKEEKTSEGNLAPYPIITALFLCTLLTIMQYPRVPAMISYILQLILFIPALTLFPALWTRLPYRYFSLSVGTVFIVIITGIFSDLLIINRLLMFFNSVLLISMYFTLLGWIKHHNRSERNIPINFAMLIVGIVSIILSFLCNIIGNTYLMSVFFSGSITAVFGGVLLYTVRHIITNTILLIVEDKILGKLHIFDEHGGLIIKTCNKITRFITVSFWLILVAKSFVVFDPIYDWIAMALSKPWSIGSMNISLGNIVAFAFTFWLTLYISKFIRFILEGEIFTRTHTSKGVAGAILMLVQLSFVAIAVIFAMGAADIDLSNITIIFGALGVGIGFGLQTIFNNLASGIILAFERPVKAGDMIQIHSLNLWGEVKEIGIRASTITTFEGADVIVPNGNLLANEMINWTHSNHRRRQEIIIGVAYGTDLDKAKNILLDVLENQVGIIKNPKPDVFFINFGESSLDFSVRFWTHFNDGMPVKSAVGIAIDNAFKSAGIEIPFPQRDLHIIQKGEDSIKVNQASNKPIMPKILDNI
ncbi:MAG: mechanosensitive ion channel family protein [Mangrovibacterium sp.]